MVDKYQCIMNHKTNEYFRSPLNHIIVCKTIDSLEAVVSVKIVYYQ